MINILQKARDLKHRRYLESLNAQRAKQAQNIRSSQGFKDIYSSLSSTFTIPFLPNGHKIWAIAMVKNEADIIEQTVTHLFHQGIDAALIVDNDSTDDTYEVLERLSEKYPIYLGRDREKAYYQSEKMTWLADQVVNVGAEWVIPFDADEFWYGVRQPLGTLLRKNTSSVLYAPIYNQFPLEQGSWALDSQPHAEGKICFRAFEGAVIEMGNHSVLRPGLPANGEIAILHRPWRSFEQFKRKLSEGAQSLSLTDIAAEKGYHWRALGQYSDQELEDVWNKLISGEDVPDALAWRPTGTLRPLKAEVPGSWSDLGISNQDL